MADDINQVNISQAMLPANTLSVKEEQWQEDSLVEDKVDISETVITTESAELQGAIRNDRIKQYEESICLDNIKTEMSSFEVTEIQNDDFKIKFDNGLLYCENCKAYYADYCVKCGMLVHILNKHVLNNTDSGAQRDIPNNILQIQDCFGQTGIYALRIIPAGVKFGPFTGLSATECPWELKGEKFVLDKNKSRSLNWMQYINPTRNICDQNLRVFQSEDNVYYQSTCQIQAGEELLVYYGEEHENSPNKIVRDIVTTTIDISENIFACTFCCLGFSSKSHLVKHKTICIKDATGKFSIEDLRQCPFCKIYFDPKEYFEQHVAFCCDSNSRKGILPIPPPSKQTTTALNRRKRCPREIYKCEVCKCSFTTNESFRLHMENTHAYVGGKDDQEHCTTNYKNTNIKVEETNSRDQKKIFKCSLCAFRAKYKYSLRIHIKTKHLREFDFKCETCDFKTNRKDHFKVHIKSKDSTEFDFKCDLCEFGTNQKSDLKRHIKTKYLKGLVYKCYSCEYGTNHKSHLEVHIKSKHSKEFDFKCDSCKYRTNNKNHLGPVFPTPVKVSG